MMPLPARYLDEFTEPSLYLNHASYGPPSVSATATAARLAEAAACGGSSAELHAEDDRARAVIARLAGRDPRLVGLTTSTSQGLMQAAFGLRGTVLVSLEEFPANVYPWLRAQDAGRLRVRPLPGSGSGTPIAVTPERIADAMTPAVTAVAVSAVDFRSGYRADLNGIRKVIGPDRLLVVDGMQAFGVADMDWSPADVLIAGGQKWLRGGWGAGFSAFSNAGMEGIAPTLGGWTGVEDAGRYDGARHADRMDAIRYSVTNLSPFAVGSLAAAAELVESVGVSTIASAVGDRHDWLADAIDDAGLDLLSPRDPARRAGIVVAGGPTERIIAIRLRLADAGATVTAHGPDRIRFAPHATTPEDAIRRVAELLTG
jgi:selenocysteine lyase/cysteine desulfurase